MNELIKVTYDNDRPDRVYAFCPSCGVLHAVDLQSIIEAEGEDFDLLRTIDYCAECCQVRKEET